MSNLSTLQTLVNWANVGVIISLALSFVFGAASIWLGGELGKLKDAEADTARQKLELALATQQERAAKAEQTLLEVQQKTRDRHLTPGLAEALTALAKRHPNQTLDIVERSGNSEEATNLANLIAWALQNGGWKIERKRESYMTIAPKYGLYCAFNRDRDQVVAGDLLVLFQQKGLRTEFWNELNSSLPLTLEVGLKP